MLQIAMTWAVVRVFGGLPARARQTILFEVVEAEPRGHLVEAHAVRSVTRLSLITVGRT